MGGGKKRTSQRDSNLRGRSVGKVNPAGGRIRGATGAQAEGSASGREPQAYGRQGGRELLIGAVLDAATFFELCKKIVVEV